MKRSRFGDVFLRRFGRLVAFLTNIFGKHYTLGMHDTVEVLDVIVFPALKSHTPKGRENKQKQNEKLNFLTHSHLYLSSRAR
jgi:hypothetical protein